MPSFRDQYTIRQGRITLYRRTAQGTKYQSDAWYAYYKIPGQKAVRRSLRTTDKLEAESLAESTYYELTQKAQRGLSLTSKMFAHVANAYLRDVAAKTEAESAIVHHERRYKPERLRNKQGIIGKYLIPYFKDRTLQSITEFDIDSYKQWRRTYWISGPGAEQDGVTYMHRGHKVVRPKRKAEQSEPHYETLNKELTILRDIFEYARLNRLIDGREIPTIKNQPRPKNLNTRKPGLTEDEVRRVAGSVGKRYRNERNPKHKRHLKLVGLYMMFMCLTGLRVAEAKGLKLSDCELITKDGKDYLKVFVRAKGKSRELVGLDGSAIVMNKLKTLHENNGELNDWCVTADMHVFSNQYGKPVGSFAKSINRALDDVGLLHDVHDVKRTAGAFRKYYITTALLSSVNYFELAKQCGTSVAIIEQYYAEIETFHRPETMMFANALSKLFDGRE